MKTEQPIIITETSDESIHATQQELLDQWIIDLIEGSEVTFWWIY